MSVLNMNSNADPDRPFPLVTAPSAMSAIGMIAGHTMNRMLKRRKLFLFLFLTSIPPFIAFSIFFELNGDAQFARIFSGLAPQAYFLFMSPLLSLFNAVSLFKDEIDDRTLTYILLRPISRISLLLGKALGAWITTSLVLTFSAVVCHVPILFLINDASVLGSWTPSDLLSFVGLLWVGSALYIFVGILIGLSFTHSTLIGLGYMGVVEILFSFAPGPPSKIAISNHLVRLLGSYYESAQELITREMGLVLPPANALHTLGGLFVALLLLAGLGLYSCYRTDFTRAEEV